MITFQDFQKIGDNEAERMAFVRGLIGAYTASKYYKMAKTAYYYNKHRNVTISEYQKILYKVTGEAIPDNWSANFKMGCNHFHRFITQEVQFLLGNGITWEEVETETKLGNKKYTIDGQLKKAAKMALWGGVSYGFFNMDHVDVFSALEFVPLLDEEDGSMKAGVRFWRIDDIKPLRATLYELDGYTEYIWRSDESEIVTPKRPYKITFGTSAIDGTEILYGENYPGFPIVPLWGNDEHQSLLVGLREQIDCYDLIKSGFANTVDEASYVYWTLQNAGGMDDVDLSKFVERMRTMHAAVVEDYNAKAESHQVETPFEARDKLLDRLDNDMYKDAMALNTDRITEGAVTATEIMAGYEDLNSKADDFEYCILQFLQGLMDLAGIEDNPTFTRSRIVNQTEMIQLILQSAQYLPNEYVTRKILDILGDGDMADILIEQMMIDEMGRLQPEDIDNEDEESGEVE